MHYKGFLITKELPTEETINQILERYNYDNEDNKSGFSWDWFQIGGRYSGGIKLKFDINNEKYEFKYCMKKRNNRLFICKILEQLEDDRFYDESDYFGYLGCYDEVINIDGGYYNDLKDFDITDCYVVIDDNDYINVRSKWTGEDYIENDNFDNEVKKINLKDQFITIIDFHD